VSKIVDPIPIIEEQIAAEVGSLHEEWLSVLEPKQRKRLEREIGRREEQIRRQVLGAQANW